MIDLNSRVVAPKFTQPPLKVIDAKMWTIHYFSVGKRLFNYHKSLETLTSEGIMRNCFTYFVLK